VYRRKPLAVNVIQFDGEEWLYLRNKAYPMIKSIQCDKDKGLFGMPYRPVLMIDEKVGIPVKHLDYIVKQEDGKFIVVDKELFESTYEKIVEPKTKESGCTKEKIMKMSLEEKIIFSFDATMKGYDLSLELDKFLSVIEDMKHNVLEEPFDKNLQYILSLGGRDE
jgi:hypothetical protein